jgi:hypothetical protein
MAAYEFDLNSPTESSTTDTAANYVEIIETVISSLQEDQSAMVSRTAEDAYLWKFNYGSVEVFVQLPGLSEEDELAVWAAVLKLPAKDEGQLFRKLMELNWTSTLEARFAIVDNQIVVCAKRALAGLSPAEVSRNITIVATIADDHDELLQAQFGTA